MTKILTYIAVIALVIFTYRSEGLILLVILSLMYAAFCIGLMLMFPRIGLPRLIGLIPMFNYYYMVVKIGLPGKWFWLSMVPILSPIYAVGIMGRLGKIFHRNIAWSTFWLTLGAPVGVYKLAFDKVEPDLKLMQAPPPSVTDLKNELLSLKEQKSKAKPAKA